MMMDAITPKQLRTLQTLYGMHAGHSLDVLSSADAKSERLRWAALTIGREVASFKDLTIEEAAQLIDALKLALGQPIRPARPRARRPMTRDEAIAAGTHGRRNRRVKVEHMAAPEDLALVEAVREAAGMTREGFEAWLKSKRSPLRGREDVTLRTVSDCNRVLWPLKAMARRREKKQREAGSAPVSAAAAV